MTKDKIEQISISYSDEVNNRGLTSWSIAEAFKAGYNYAKKELTNQLEFNAWKIVKNMEFLAHESGDWDGKRSDIYLGKYANGNYCLFRIYAGFLDGNDFTDYYDQNDNSIDIPNYYKQI
jgi:hypothetical protein